MTAGDKAVITNVDKPGESVTCTFRPKELTFSKQNTWTAGPAKGKDAAEMEFAGGGNAKLQLELLFDSSGDAGDVRDETKKLWKMTKIDPSTRRRGDEKGRPPRVQFQWGVLNSFYGVIESISEKFVLFNADGKPVRSMISLALTQFNGEGPVPQNPTSIGTGGHTVRVIREGETLDLIAYEE